MTKQHRFHRSTKRPIRSALVMFVSALFGFQTLFATAATQNQAQKTFATPEEAVRALIAAVKSKSADALFAVIGEEMRGTLSTGNSVLDSINVSRFLKAASVHHNEKDKA